MFRSIGWSVGRRISGLAILLIAIGFGAVAGPAGAANQGSTFITTSLPLPKGGQPAADSGYSDYRNAGNPISANGRFVAFQSDATFGQPKVIPDKINVFRKDRSTGKIILISRGDGANGNGISTWTGDLSISGSGNLVAFTTKDRLDPADTDDFSDIYIRNVSENTTTLATPGTPQSAFSPQLSGNGQYILFDTASQLTGTDLNGSPDVFRRRLSDGNTELVSRIPASVTAGNKSSFAGDLSDDGRWVVFTSASTDLVPGFVDNNGQYSRDVFLRDMDGGDTTLISCNYANATTTGNDESSEPVIAGTATNPSDIKVAYASSATDVAAPGVDSSSEASVYLRTPDSTASTLISVNSSGENANSRAHTPSISRDGGRIVFTSDASNLGGPDSYYGVYLRDRGSNKTTMVSAHNFYAVFGAISSDGKAAAWSERGSDSGADPDVNNVFARSLPYGKIAPVSRPAGASPFVLPGAMVSSSLNTGAQISRDGRYVVVMSSSNRLPGYRKDAIQAYRRDLKTGQWTLVSRANGANGAPSKEGAYAVSISADGSKVLFLSWVKLSPDDTDDKMDAYVRDLTKGTTTLVSRADGATGSDADGSVSSAAISGNGRRVVFSTYAENLGVPGGKSQIYVRDLVTNKTILVSRADGNAGAAGNDDSDNPDISIDGNVVSFSSYSDNLNPDDASNNRSIFVRNISAATTTLVSRQPGLAGTNAAGTQSSPDLSGNGKFVAWLTEDQSVAPEAGLWPVNQNQIVIRKIANGENSLVSRGPGSGDPADAGAGDVSLSDDGSVAAFSSYSTNLISGLGGTNRSAIFVRDIADGGSLSGPPAFGQVDNLPTTGAFSPSISGNGLCVAFSASGHNAASGIHNNLYSGYVYAAGGRCDKPPASSGGPVISSASIKPAKLSLRSGKGVKIRFRIDRNAAVTFYFDKKAPGRVKGGKCRKPVPGKKGGKKCVRFVYTGRFTKANLPSGANVVVFKGKVGKKKLTPGNYRVRLRAADLAGSSKDLPLSLKVTRR